MWWRGFGRRHGIGEFIEGGGGGTEVWVWVSR